MIVTDIEYLKNTQTLYCNLFDNKCKSLMQKLKDELKQHETGLGLSAIQIGEPYKLFCIDMAKLRMYFNSNIFGPGDIIIFAGCTYNPMTTISRNATEGCLSLPEKSYIVKRPNKISIRGCAIGDDWHICSFDGLILHSIVARVFMHECDHQDNILISDIGELKNAE